MVGKAGSRIATRDGHDDPEQDEKKYDGGPVHDQIFGFDNRNSQMVSAPVRTAASMLGHIGTV